MRKRFRLCWILLFFATTLLSQNNPKIAPSFIYLKEQQSNTNVANQSTNNKYSGTITSKKNSSTGITETGFNCIIYTKSPELLLAKGIALESIHPTFSTAWLSLRQLDEVAAFPEVQFIDMPKNFKKNNDIAVAGTGAFLLHSGRLNNTQYKGEGIIVAIIDSGIDWDHPDFRDPLDQTKSRILRIWDQTITAGPGENAPQGFTFGVEYTQAHINNEIDGSPAGFVREKDTDGHGTHVAGTAAGNGAALSPIYSGLAPKSDIVVVKAGNGTFSTSNLIAALDYLKNLATSLSRPIVVNMSLGSQSGAHDGTDPLEVAIDNFTNTAAGRIVVVAAGNENGENIHKQAIVNSNSSVTVDVVVPSITTTQSKEVFQFSAYANDASEIASVVTAPDGTQVSTFSANGTLVMDGLATVYLSNFIDPGSGDRKIEVEISRTSFSANVTGTWSIKYTNSTNSTITIDGWLDNKGKDYSDAFVVGGDNNYLVAIPGCATKAVTVGSFMAKIDWFGGTSTGFAGYSYTSGTQDDISRFSSVGPRRDNVLKPDITANGQAVVSCLSSDSGLANSSAYNVVNGLYKVEQGTSMATPAVAGCVALLLQMKPNATFTEIKNAITTTATKDSFTGPTANPTWGSGKINIFKAASSFSYCQPLTVTTFNYEQPYNNTQNTGVNLNSSRAAVRFTTTTSGLIGGVYFKTGTSINLTSFSVELRTNTNGNPGTLLGTVIKPPTTISKNTWNFIDLSSLAVELTSATDYFIVLVPNSGGTLSLGQEGSNSGRSYFSSDGISWTSSNNFRIRAVAYGLPAPGIPTLTLSSGAGTNIQSLCNAGAITPITFSTTGVTTATVTGLPAGITANWQSNTLTISGTPTETGVFNYVVKITSSCDTATATGTITIGKVPTVASVVIATGNTITVNGDHFSVNGTTVTIGGVQALISSVTRTTIIATLPSSNNGGPIVVTNSCNLSSLPFTYPFKAPTNISLSSNFIIQNNSVGATIGILSATDTDTTDSFTYALVSGTGSTDNGNFRIENNQLKAAVVFSVQTKVSHSIRIKVTDAGGLSFEKTFTITVVTDLDADGVRDDEDQCPNTIAGVKVDFKGCEIFLLPSDNFSALVTATSCVGQKNGSISVSAKNTTFIYDVTINGQTGFQLNAANSFTNQFQNLAPGSYEICISVQGKPNYLQCYNLIVREPSILALTNKVSASAKQVTYNLSGSSSYNVTLNGQTKKYFSNEITLNLEAGQNVISIATDMDCQGKFEQTVFLGDQIIFYPNPVLDYVTLFFPGTDQEVTITTMSLSATTKEVVKCKLDASRMAKLNLSGYASGLYIVRVKGDQFEETIKVIKQ